MRSRPPSRWPVDPASAPLSATRRNRSYGSFGDMLAAQQSQSSQPASHKRAQTPPPESPPTRAPSSAIRPRKAETDRVGAGRSRARSGRSSSSDAEVVTPAAGIILLREKPAISELDDAAWETQELEVLIGRYEVVDALRSTRDRLVALRYPGEWHFPGGAKRQTDTGPLQTACRELQEEFLGGCIGAAPELAATLFTKVSLGISGRRYVQYVFVADEANNRCGGVGRAFKVGITCARMWSEWGRSP